MYPITHIVIGGGATWALHKRWYRRARKSPPVENRADVREPAVPPGYIDYRLVALGALLPDLIDKPLKWFLFSDSLPDDHLFGHTLLLPALLLVPGIYLVRRGDWRLLSMGVAALTHLLADPVILHPKTLFWPLFGLEFPDSKSFTGGYQVGVDVLIVVVLAGLALSGRPWPRWRTLLRSGSLSQRAEPSH